uniref:Uncharacterized protein n=1 Tax=Grammatophora oceanica TaxID=210454 RepID=A0A7S1YHU0_9STRA|mmetsp:Transcript_47819/g.71168  ORF Transcript_47819/g.71168 Transcript_47819/m.71168 type:complete len:101 (+) Transcript_47819:119-421(+)
MLFFGNRMYDFHALVFRDKTIVDGCHINGHYQIGSKLVIDKSIQVGVLHDGCFTMAGTVMKGSSQTETGPWRAMFPSLAHAAEDVKEMKSCDDGIGLSEC